MPSSSRTFYQGERNNTAPLYIYTGQNVRSYLHRRVGLNGCLHLSSFIQLVWKESENPKRKAIKTLPDVNWLYKQKRHSLTGDDPHAR